MEIKRKDNEHEAAMAGHVERKHQKASELHNRYNSIRVVGIALSTYL